MKAREGWTFAAWLAAELAKGICRCRREAQRHGATALTQVRRQNARLRARLERQQARNRLIWDRIRDELTTEAAELAVPCGPPDKAPANPPDSSLDTLTEVATEAWGLARSAEDWIGQLGERRQRRARSRVESLRSRLTELLAGEEIVLQDLTGRVWDEGDAVEVVNPAEPEEGQQARITAMLEPIVIHRGRLMRRGKVSITLEGRNEQ